MLRQQSAGQQCGGIFGRIGLLILGASLTSAIVLESPARGQFSSRSVGGSGPRSYAILIGVEKYRQATPLEYTLNDVVQLEKTLFNNWCEQRDLGTIYTFVETTRNEDRLPLRENLLSELPKCLSVPGSRDMVLVYFTGHGFRDRAGKLYLAPLDCDPANPAATGIAVEWLRAELGKCKAHFKFLVLDACHAGSEKGPSGARGVVAKDIAAEFAKSPGVVTLASCTGDEKSLIWGEKRQSLFSYWLNQGLRGHADADGNGEVNIDELYQYLAGDGMLPGKVQYVAQKHFNRSQTPARFISPDVTDVPIVIRPTPYTLKVLLTEMAEQLATEMQLRGIERVGVPEFAVDAKKAELELGVEFGTLGRYCASELAGCLNDHSAERFEVVEHDALQAALRDRGLAMKDLRTSRARSVTPGGKELSALALGILRSRAGREITLQCELLGTERQVRLGRAGGTALLNDSEWAMLGRSAQRKPDDRQAAQQGDIGRPGAAIPQLDAQSGHEHPLAPGQKRDFPVRILVDGRERKATFSGNEMFVQLAPGEVYEIRAKNTTARTVLMRLLVDGLNTLPEPVRTKDITVEAKQRQPAYLPAQRVNLAEAQAWRLEPNMEYGVVGFFGKTGVDGKYQAFRVVDASQSLAARQQFNDQLGLITAAFYAAVPKTRGSKGQVATAFGPGYRVPVEQYENLLVGDLLGVVHIRYGAP